MQHWFWLGLSVATVGWYLAVTIYVAIRGAKDIKQMFRRLEEQSRSSGCRSHLPSQGDML